MAREIPEGSVEIQTGLYLYTQDLTIGGVAYTFRELYSSDGYCFYENHLAEEERIYMQWCSVSQLLNTVEKINAWFTSVPIEEGMEIVSAERPNVDI